MGTAVVTGAAGGIGRALAVRLAAQGHRVHLADIEDTTDLAARIGGVAHTVDLATAADVARLADAAPDADVVCLDAGTVGTSSGAPWEVPPEEWQHLLDVTLLGVVNGLRVFVPRLLSAGRPGRVLITASLAGLVTFPGGGAQAAAAHALVAVAQQAALALAGTPVTVTLLCPAVDGTGRSDAGADAADVAAAALDAAAAGRFLVVPPEWSDPVVSAAEHLVSGAPPRVPAPGRDRVRQLRLVVAAEDDEAALRFYRDRLGLTEELHLDGDAGERVTILRAGRATLELSNPAQVDMIDRVEVGRRISPHLRVAFEVDDAATVTADLVDAGGRLLAPPTRTPWDSLNARLDAPAGLQVTIFEELGERQPGEA